MMRNFVRTRVTILNSCLRPLIAAFVVLGVALCLQADEPFARSRDYDLQHSKIVLRFDTDQKKVIGDVTHTLSILHDATAKSLSTPSASTIQSVTVNKSPAKFESTADKLIIPLACRAKTGDKFDIEIRYEGKT